MNNIYLLNGATGTELMKSGFRGIKQGDWILNNKGIYSDLQNAYVLAGSEIVYTPTFAMNREKLKTEHDEDRTEEINRLLAALCLETEAARAGGSHSEVRVFGNLGPSGIFVPPAGKASLQQLYDIYFEQAEILLKAGCQGIAIETMMSAEDVYASVTASLAAIGSSGAGLGEIPVLVSCSCNKNGRLLTGADICDVLRQIEPLGISAFGINCCSPEAALVQIKRLHEMTDLPLLAKPNAGLPVIRGKQTVYDCGPEEFASYIPAFIENGVRYVGGCCGTTPGHIRAIKKVLDSYRK